MFFDKDQYIQKYLHHEQLDRQTKFQVLFITKSFKQRMKEWLLRYMFNKYTIQASLMLRRNSHYLSAGLAIMSSLLFFKKLHYLILRR